MARGKVRTFIVVPSDTAPRTTRLIKGTLREVEQKLRGEVEIRPVTVDEARAMHAVEVETCEDQP
jgi:hypothetical protein